MKETTKAIVADPEMLEALKAIVALLDHAGVASDTAPAYNVAVQAIAKATGTPNKQTR
jgi:hypothetical protein